MSNELAKSEFDEKVDRAETLVLISSAGAVVGAIGLIHLFGIGIGNFIPTSVVIRLGTPTSMGWLATFGGLLVSIIFYHLALPAYRDASESFRALVDINMPKFVEWLKKAPTDAPGKERKKLDVDVRMYLGSLDTD